MNLLTESAPDGLRVQENRCREAAPWKNVTEAFVGVMRRRVGLTTVPRSRPTGLLRSTTQWGLEWGSATQRHFAGPKKSMAWTLPSYGLVGLVQRSCQEEMKASTHVTLAGDCVLEKATPARPASGLGASV
jgi:hypothetical protein